MEGINAGIVACHSMSKSWGRKNLNWVSTEGTIYQFDWSSEGVRVSVDGNEQGKLSFWGMVSRACIDASMDDKVNPILSATDSWCGSGS